MSPGLRHGPAPGAMQAAAGTPARVATAADAADLTRAFEDGILLLHYQPQVDVAQRWPRIVGYEALARWTRPDSTIVPPEVFIPVAEACGLVTALDLWVIETACAELARMKATGGAGRVGMSANVSTQQFAQPRFAGSVAAILSRTGVDPACLTLEITERAVLNADRTALANIHALREMGVSLALDDFGTGHSSLLQLSALPVQEIKMDRGFLVDLPDRPKDVAILRATIGLASGLGLRVVAEGVERAQQAAWLRANGCHLIQGFLYGRPSAFGGSRPGRRA